MDSVPHEAGLPAFPAAQQAQTIRANQRDLLYVYSLKEQAENVLRAWLGNRWLTRWDKEVDLLAKLLYYGITTGQASQTLGEEYTNIWQTSPADRGFPSLSRRAALVFLPALPAYVLSRFGSRLSTRNAFLAKLVRYAPAVLDTLSEINLAIFYFSGVYYTLAKRLLRIRSVSGIAENPNARPPSYALLGILIGIRLLHRLVSAIQTYRREVAKEALREVAPSAAKGKMPVRGPGDGDLEASIDGVPVSELLSRNEESMPPVPAEEDAGTAMDFRRVPDEMRARRNCTLCLEERTSSCATECGHLFCWPCIVNWGREKAECPLCRQALNLTRLVPIHNL